MASVESLAIKCLFARAALPSLLLRILVLFGLCVDTVARIVGHVAPLRAWCNA